MVRVRDSSALGVFDQHDCPRFIGRLAVGAVVLEVAFEEDRGGAGAFEAGVVAGLIVGVVGGVVAEIDG